MDRKKLQELNIIACQDKKKTFTWGKYVVRSTIGCLDKPCCGNGCHFCPYGNQRDSKVITKESEKYLKENSVIYDW